MSEIRARVKLHVGLNQHPAEIVSFKGFTTDNEHVAIVFNNADKTDDAPFVRIHSECLTGDVFHSSRCDCGEQLEETIEKMSKTGGIILYMRQEGRGIGLYNKLDAYVLQSQGMNTYQANKALGFGEDEREYSDAIHMLKAMSVTALKLITNNPKKINALSAHFELIDHQRTGTFIKKDNLGYLQTKSTFGSHLLNKEQLDEKDNSSQEPSLGSVETLKVVPSL